jgi:hypothetical protein
MRSTYHPALLGTLENEWFFLYEADVMNFNHSMKYFDSKGIKNLIKTNIFVFMPEISRFYGIIIKMFFKDHAPPHFHVEYNEYKAIVDIHEKEVLDGFLPGKVLKLVQAWAIIHEDELIENFLKLSESPDKWKKIAPLK